MMDAEKPQVLRKARTKEEENAQKCLDIILNYSRNASKQKEYVAHPQTMLKDDLKRDFGGKTAHALGINQQIIPGKKLEVGNCQSSQSIKSHEINEFINKYICLDGSTNNSNNTLTLNHNELFRLKAGGSLLSRESDTYLEKPCRHKTGPVRVCTCPDKNKITRHPNRYHRFRNHDMKELKIEVVHAKPENNESTGPTEASVKQLIDTLLSDQIDRSEENAALAGQPLNSLVSDVIDSSGSEINQQTIRDFMQSMRSDNLESNENNQQDVSSFLKSMVSDKIESSETNHVSFAQEPHFPAPLDGDVNTSDDTEDENSDDQERVTPNRTTKAKVTILEFDRIFNEEIKRRRGGGGSTTDLAHPSVKVKTENNTQEEASTSVKTALIHSAVAGLPHDIPFNEDFELMNAIDKFIQADNACKFEEALKAAEQAAKSAPAGLEEEAAASAAKNYQFQCDQRDNFNSILLDEKKKPIEIVAYVGSTNIKKNPSSSECPDVLKSK